MKLIDSEIKAAQPKSKPYKLSDGDGLVLLIQPNGSKWWRYRYRFGGKENTISLGVYPKISLKEARKKRDEARELLDENINPSAHRQDAKYQQSIAAANSFESVARQWLEHWKPTKSEHYVVQTVARLEKDLFPSIGSRPIAELTVREFRTAIQKIQNRGAPDPARRAFKNFGQIMRYAIIHEMAERNPAAGIKPSDILETFVSTNYARVDEKDLPGLLRSIDSYTGSVLTILAMKLLALTFVRTSELIGATWPEIDFINRQWRVPGVRMKKKTIHIVPLSNQAISLLEKLKMLTGGQDFLFPSERGDGRIMGSNTILRAIERMGFKGKMTAHGFRGVASTILNEQGKYPEKHIELQLAHLTGNATKRAYDAAKHLDSRALMMQDWADYLDELRSKTDKLYLK